MSTIQTKQWTRKEYQQMAEAGLFRPNERVELIHGEIFTMSPQNSRHAVAIGNTEAALQRAFGPEHWVRVQMPLALSSDSEPEPDLAVVPGPRNTYLTDHPVTALLIVEISDTTLHFDQNEKLSLYAQGQISEYWIVNVANHTLEVYRNPQGSSYEEHHTLSPTQSINPPHTPNHSILVGDLLPL